LLWTELANKEGVSVSYTSSFDRKIQKTKVFEKRAGTEMGLSSMTAGRIWFLHPVTDSYCIEIMAMAGLCMLHTSGLKISRLMAL